MFRISKLFYNPSVQRILKSTFIYAGGDFLNKAIPFMLIPVLTRFLSTEDYGMLAAFMAIFGVVQIIISMGTTEAIIRGYFDSKKEDFYFSEYVFNGLLINFFVFSVIILLWFMSKNLLIKLIPIPFGFQLLIPFLGLFVGVSTIPSKLWVYMKKPLPFTVFNVLRTLLEVVLSIWLVVFLGFGWDGRVLGIFVGKGLFFIIGIGALLHSGFLRISLNIDHIKSIVRYGVPIVLHSLGFVVIAAIDQFFLYTFISLSATGIYSVSYSFCSIIVFIIGSLNLALSPMIYERLDNATDAFKQKLVKYTYCYFLLIFMGVAAFIFLAPGFLNIYLGEAFLDAKKFIFWLALGFGFHSLYIMIVSYIFYSKKTHMLSKIAVITVILSVVLNYILIRWNGAIGVAQATCLVFLSRFLMAWYASHKVYPLPWFSFMNRTRET